MTTAHDSADRVPCPFCTRLYKVRTNRTSGEARIARHRVPNGGTQPNGSHWCQGTDWRLSNR